MIRALDRMLLRDLSRMKAQAAAIALVVAAAVSTFVATATTYRSLELSEHRYYHDQRFAHVWARVSHAPRRVVADVATLAGVAAAEGRLQAEAVLDVPGIDEPVTGLIISVPHRIGHSLNDLYVRRGRHIEPGRPGEVLVNEAFAIKNGLAPGHSLLATIAGHRIMLHVVGVALSPEFVMQVPPGGLVPDDRLFGVFWMSRDELEALLDLPDAVNEVAVRLADLREESAVVAGMNRILDRYGGQGAYGRTSQPSHVMLEDHITPLKGLALVVPTIFLVVAAFLVSMISARLIGIQRLQIGMLKAFGYSGSRLIVHYLEFVFVIVAIGLVVGIPIGTWLGYLMASWFATFFRFPVLVFRLEPAVIFIGAITTIVASTIGALGSLRRVAALPAAASMAPAAPIYRPRLSIRFKLPLWISSVSRMIARNLSRWPLRAVFTTVGMSLGIAVLVLGGSTADSLNRVIDVQFHTAQREDIAVALTDAVSMQQWRDLEGLPGVRTAEPYRIVAARLSRYGRVPQDVLLRGLPDGGRLRRIVDQTNFAVLPPPTKGALVSGWLAARYDLHRGDLIALEIREGQRRTVRVRVVGMVNEPLGASVYMELDALGVLLREPARFSGANLLVDHAHQAALFAAIKRAPAVRQIALRRNAIANYRAMADGSVRFVRQLVIVFSVIIAFGVVYNNARIALAERGYELATLRVLGFTRGEISAALLGEIGVLMLPAIPLGLGVGYWLSSWVATAMSSERFRMPLVIATGTYIFAISVFTLAAVASALLVRRRLDRLDLIGVLKARE